MKNKIELLAPAGSFDALRAAVEAGANAVYLAGESFGARAYAENFTRETLPDAVKYAHLKNVAVHITTNTILADDELDKFADYIKFLRKANVDAFLIQDLGVAEIAKQIAPEIPLHASTQMTIHNLEGVLQLEKLGFTRAVLSRELSLTEIEHIAKNSPLEIEIFMHGALCVCYSGQCLMSSLIGGRSGNRGRCAQPCRLPYTLVDENNFEVLKNAGEYLLSPKDLNTLDLLPQIVSSGVTSLKIEGRMKRAEYVATVVKVYRAALDRIFADKNFSATPEEQRQLAQIFNRDFTTAYLEKNQGKNLISDKRPNNRGILIGRIVAVDKNKISIKLAEKINLGDQIEIWIKVGGRKTFTAEKFVVEKDICTLEVLDTRGIKMHDRVFKIFDAELTAKARKIFTEIKKIPVTAKVEVAAGKNLTLTLTDDEGNFATAKTNFVAEVAKNRPLTFETVQKQIGRLGNTIFELNSLEFNCAENLMVPVSELNEVRRKVIELLEIQRLKKFDKVERWKDGKVESFNYALRTTHYALIAAVDSLDKVKVAIENGADAILFGGENFNNRPCTAKEILSAEKIVRDAGKKFYLSTPRIVRESEIDNLQKILSLKVFDAVYVHNLATLSLAKKFNLKIHTDFSLITFNNFTIDCLKNLGVESVTLSPEMTLEQIKSLAKKSPLPVECIVHGRMELMISSYCVLGSFLGDIDKKNCPHICRTKNFYLRDRKNILFPVACDQFCRMHILNSKTLSMIEHRKDFEGVNMRVDCRFLDLKETAEVIHAYKFGGAEIENFTRGHYFRGVTDDKVATA